MIKKQKRALIVSIKRLISQQHISPHSIAMGFAIGIGIGVGPTFGFQMIPAFLLCSYFGYNKVSGVIGVWISNPLTVIPIYAFSFSLGKFLTNNNEIKFETLKYFLLHPSWEDFTKLGNGLFKTFFIGSLATSIFGGLFSYFIAKYIVVLMRKRKERKRKIRMEENNRDREANRTAQSSNKVEDSETTKKVD